MDIDWDKVEKYIVTLGVEVYPLEKCTIGHCLGSGSVMEVFEGKCSINAVTTNVAFKCHKKFKSSTLEQKDVNKILQDFQHEITSMKRLKYSTNVVQIYGVTFETKKPVLIVELGNQTLSRYLLDKAESGTPATWHEKIKLCDDVSRGIRCLHDAGIIHGDIKGDNVLAFIESTGITTAKLSGFGYSSTFNSSDVDIGRNKISMAPETRGIEDLKAWEEKPTQDIFNFGLVIYQIANDGKAPHKDSEGILKVDSNNRHTEMLLADLRSDTPEAFRMMVTSTTKYMPTERASLDIVEKIISDFQNVSSSQQDSTANIPLPSLDSYIESPQSQLLPSSTLKTIPHSLNSKQFYHDGLKDDSKTAELNEAKRNYENAKNTLEHFIVFNDALDVNKLPIPPSLKPSIFHEYQRLSEIGDDFAQYMSGVCWVNGFGTEKNDLKAIESFTKASEAGNPLAQNILGVFYKEGRGVIKDMSKAIKLYTMAAEAGNIKAQFNLGVSHANGEGVTQDLIKAVEWYTKAAEANYLPAHRFLSDAYRKGLGVAVDTTKAIEWCKKGAKGGDSWSQHNLGYWYQWGDGIPKNEFKAVEWYTKSAEVGHKSGLLDLGRCYEKGIGVTRDYSKAIELYTMAANAGSHSARLNLSKLRRKDL